MLGFLQNAYATRLRVEVPALQHVDWYAQQDRLPADKHPYARPAAFMEFRLDPLRTLGQNVQEFNYRCVVHVISSHQDAAQNNARDEHMALDSAISRALHGYRTDQVDTIERVGYDPDHNAATILHTRLTFAGRAMPTDLARRRVSWKGLLSDLPPHIQSNT